MTDQASSQQIKSYINELGDEYKNDLYEALLRDSPSARPRISRLVDIDRRARLVLERGNLLRKERRILLLAQVYIFVGLAVYLSSEIVTDYQHFDFISVEQLWQVFGIIMCCAGCVLQLLYLWHSARVKRRIEPLTPRNILMRINTLWHEIDAICDDLLAQKGSLTDRQASITTLFSLKLIAEAERDQLFRVLALKENPQLVSSLFFGGQDMRRMLFNDLMGSESIAKKIGQRLKREYE